MKIRTRLTLFGMFVTTLVMLMSQCIFLAHSYRSDLKGELETAEALTEMVAYNSQGAVGFQDHEAANSILAGLKSESGVVSATIVLDDGTILANFETYVIPEDERRGMVEVRNRLTASWHHVRLLRPIEWKGELFGQVEVFYSLNSVNSRFISNLVISLLVLLGGSVVAFGLALFLQGFITKPLFHMLRAVQKIAEEKDYQHRLDEVRTDEFGLLIKNFNMMINEIQKRDDSLEQTVKDRTADFERAAKEAQAASQAKSDFLANMSHEIRTPLTGIVGMVNLLNDERLDQGLRELVVHISRSADALLNIISDVLDFSKIEEGKLEIDSRQMAVYDLVRDAYEMFEHRASESDVVLVKFVAPNTPHYLSGDKGRIMQILINLIGNSLKFTRAGGGILIMTWAEMQGDGSGKLHFVVADSGIGIPKDKFGLIFESFTQADTSTTRRFGGTGLGLAIVKRLTHLMGGEVKVDSIEGVGTKFHFWIAVRECDAPSEAESNDAANARVIDRTLEVLLVDDNEINQKLIEKLLVKMGYAVTIAGDGQQAVDACADKFFDVILMDIQMPVLDGLAATRIIRDSYGDWGRSVPIIGLSAHAFRDDASRSLAQGMTDYLTKPFRPPELRDLINKLVQ